MTRRRWRYRADGTSYEVPVDRQARARAPAVHVTEAIGADGKPIPAAQLRELNRQGKALHIEECRNIAMDAHNENQRQAAREKLRRKAALVEAAKRHTRWL